MERKERDIKAFGRALVSQKWFTSMEKEYLEEITKQEVIKTFYSTQILCKNEFVNNKGTTVDFLRRMIDIRTREGQIPYLFIYRIIHYCGRICTLFPSFYNTFVLWKTTFSG